MNDLIQTIRNIFKIPELRERILTTLWMLLVYRLGTYVILPGIDSNALQSAFDAGSSSGGGLLDLFNAFLGGAFSRGSLFALGIMPYISASIVVQLLAAVVPSIQRLRMEGDSGTKKINQITRLLTVVITLVQSVSYITYLQSQYPDASIGTGFFWFISIFLLTAGTLFLVWLGERITDKGIGNGTSLIIMIGIISGFPGALINEFRSQSPMIFFFEVLALGLVTMGVIALTQATRRIPINYARQMMGGGRQGAMMGKAPTQARQYIPLKMNATGVMPIIFAQAIMFLPTYLLKYLENDQTGMMSAVMGDYTSIWYNLFLIVLIVVFTYFYTAITVNPNEIADQLKRNGGFIPGIKPGKKTAEYIDAILSKITLPGAICLGLVAIMPAIASAFGVSGVFSKFFGGTTILIMIGVVLDTLQQIESYLLNRHYDGLMKTGRVKGRQKSGVVTS
ncbi:MAG: preprotein translocase subunit SecY [Bacteroidia bacterium]